MDTASGKEELYRVGTGENGLGTGMKKKGKQATGRLGGTLHVLSIQSRPKHCVLGSGLELGRNSVRLMSGGILEQSRGILLE